MAFLVGTDEAGYGPNLGPLVISATVWHVPGELNDLKLYKTLRRVVCSKPLPSRPKRVAIADSKLLYRPGEGIGLLERGVLSALRATGVRAHRWRDLWEVLDPRAGRHLDTLPWYIGFDGPAPCKLAADDLYLAGSSLQQGLGQAGVTCYKIRSRAVFPQELNEACERYGSKGEALSQLTLELVEDVISKLDDEQIVVHCDKHGGRNRYAPVLQQRFPDYLIEIRKESRAESIYSCGPRNRRCQFHFAANGESCLPSALASMVSKYLRELALQAFNHFWRCHLPELRPTAGYPGDSWRFKAEIETVQRALGIDDHILWRRR